MKYAYLVFLIIGFYLGSDSQNSFSAQLNIPENVVQGESCTFELEIYKPQNVRGYTVFNQKFPNGFYVKEIDVNGAEFSYMDNELSITWLRIPADEKITVYYEVSPMFGITGDFNLSGQLTYMISGNQGKFDLRETVLHVLKEKKIELNNTNPEDNFTLIQLNKKIYKDISCLRTQSFNTKKNEYIIEVLIKKKGSGSYHLIEQIPKNYQFEEITSDNASFNFQNDKASFLWENVPENKDINIKYKLVPADAQTEEPKIKGKLSILINGQLMNIPVLN